MKSAAYLQSWQQARPSAITFGRLTGQPWSDTEGWGAEREVRADVFVFALQTQQDPTSYDALDLTASEFRVLPASAVKQLGVRSIGLATLRRLAPNAVTWEGLREAVRQAAQAHGSDDQPASS